MTHDNSTFNKNHEQAHSTPLDHFHDKHKHGPAGNSHHDAHHDTHHKAHHDSELEKQFKQAQEDVTSLDERPSNPDLLILYAHYKQATDGNCTGERPGMMDFVNRAKYDAWHKLEGMHKKEAMQTYVNKVAELMKD